MLAVSLNEKAANSRELTASGRWLDAGRHLFLDAARSDRTGLLEASQEADSAVDLVDNPAGSAGRRDLA